MSTTSLPLLTAKLEVPPPPAGAIARRRIARLLSESRGQVTSVVAGPGYGKTVAMAQWLLASDGATAWVSLDSYDDNPTTFWRYVIAALRRACPSLGDDAEAMLIERREGDDAFLMALLDGLQGCGPFVLVLDDFHVIGSPEVIAQFTFFAEHLPAGAELVVVSRFDPPIPIGRWRAGGRLDEIRQRELRFDAVEARDLLRSLHTDADVGELVERTEGWPVALQLLVSAVAHTGAPAGMFHEADRMLADYLVAEVLDRLDEEDRKLLLSLSVLHHFDAELAVAVSGQHDAGRRLRNLEARNLFLIPLDDRREQFRYHHLLRELLAQELVWRHHERVAVFHARAARALEGSGDARTAVEHYVSAGDHENAFRLVIAPVMSLVDAGEMSVARAWLDHFPSEFVHSSPDRMLRFMMVLGMSGRLD
ncbi:MAG: hypothetical protein ACRD12_15975, partial [Acidimicrobiales bacterium]